MNGCGRVAPSWNFVFFGLKVVTHCTLPRTLKRQVLFLTTLPVGFAVDKSRIVNVRVAKQIGCFLLLTTWIPVGKSTLRLEGYIGG